MKTASPKRAETRFLSQSCLLEWVHWLSRTRPKMELFGDVSSGSTVV